MTGNKKRRKDKANAFKSTLLATPIEDGFFTVLLNKLPIIGKILTVSVPGNYFEKDNETREQLNQLVTEQQDKKASDDYDDDDVKEVQKRINTVIESAENRIRKHKQIRVRVVSWEKADAQHDRKVNDLRTKRKTIALCEAVD